MFKAGVPYDADTNEFKVGPAEIARLDWQRKLDEQEENWMRRKPTFRSKIWDDED
jgi:hypothetical protein